MQKTTNAGTAISKGYTLDIIGLLLSKPQRKKRLVSKVAAGTYVASSCIYSATNTHPTHEQDTLLADLRGM